VTCTRCGWPSSAKTCSSCTSVTSAPAFAVAQRNKVLNMAMRQALGELLRGNYDGAKSTLVMALDPD
jgi:hypothetical protein